MGHIRVDKTTIDRVEQTSFNLVALILYGPRDSSHCFIYSITRTILDSAVLPDGGGGDDCPSGGGYNPKRFVLKVGEADDPGCEDSYQLGLPMEGITMIL